MFVPGGERGAAAPALWCKAPRGVQHLLIEADPEKFFRIHRSRIVNMERIQELQPWLNGEYAVLLRTGTRLTLSRGYREKLQDRLRA